MSPRCATTKRYRSELVTGLLDGTHRRHPVEETLSVRSVEFFGDPARCQLGPVGVKPTHHPGALVADIGVALGQEPQHLGMIGSRDGPKGRRAQRSHGDRQGVVRVEVWRHAGASG
jgi:hypothetical protein